MVVIRPSTVSTFLLLMHSVFARGPHHPKDAKIVKRHVHTRPSKDVKITQDLDLLHDREHIQEHLDEIIAEPDITNMSDEELEFHFFQMHDLDKNLKLDGLEILQAILHTSEHDDETNGPEEQTELSDSGWTLDSYVDLIDRVFREDDYDNNGYLSYEEYKMSRREPKMSSLKKSRKKINDLSPV